MVNLHGDSTLVAGFLLLLVFWCWNTYWRTSQDWRHLEITPEGMPDIKSLAGNGKVGKLVQIVPTISMPRAGSRVSCPEVNPHDLSGVADIKPLWTELAGEAIMIES